MAREVLSDGTVLTLACVLRFEFLNDAMCKDASVLCLAKQLDAGQTRDSAKSAKTPNPKCA